MEDAKGLTPYQKRRKAALLAKAKERKWFLLEDDMQELKELFELEGISLVTIRYELNGD